MQTLGNKCQIFVLLKGLIDVPREVARIEEKLQKLEGQMAKLVASMNIEGYEEKVGSLCCDKSSTTLSTLGWDFCHVLAIDTFILICHKLLQMPNYNQCGKAARLTVKVIPH